MRTGRRCWHAVPACCHCADDQSWPLVINALPLLAAKGAYTPLHVYNHSDLAELVQVRGSR